VTDDNDPRWLRLQQNEEAILGAYDVIITMVRLHVGPYEIHDWPEYEHIDIDTRYVEAASFYYWLVASLILNSTDYEFKEDFAQAVANAVVQALPGVAPILADRYREYAYPESAPLSDLVAKAAQRFLQHMDPSRPVPERFSGPDLGHDLLESARSLFNELPALT
jgi:hypothetical protein